MVSVTGTSKHKPEVVDLIDRVSGLIATGAYAEASGEIATFNKAHPGLLFFVQEALPSRVSDHLLKKTGAHVAFTTYTLRHPNWASDLATASTQPETFERLVTSIETALLADRKAA